MKKQFNLLMLLSMVIFFGISTVIGQEQGEVFEQRQKEKMANDKLVNALKAETNKKEFRVGIKTACSGEKNVAKETVNLKLANDEILAVFLESILSSGFRWSLDPGYKGGLELAAKNLEPSAIPGGISDSRFVFKPTNKGVTSLRFIYHRPWEDKAPLKECIVNVTSAGKYQGTFSFIEEPAKPVEIKIEKSTNKALPSSFDWRSQGKVTSVKDQGNSNACWAFGTCASTESAILIAGGSSRDLSEQYLCNCDANASCDNGGWFTHWLFKDNGRGVVYESDVPFQGTDQSCGNNTYHEKVTSWGWTDGVSDSGWPQLNHNASTTEIKEAIYNHGPVAANSNSDCWANTTAIQDVNCTGGPHIVTIVGWDDANGGYWIIKNSWGTGWGDNGYLYLRYGRSEMGDYSVWVNVEDGSSTTCDLATNLSSSSITENSAYIDWDSPSSSHTGFNVAYRKNNETDWTYKSTSSSNYNLTGLSSDTEYQYGVKTICSSDSESDWTEWATFKTTVGNNNDDNQLTDGVAANGNIDENDVSDMWFIDVAANATSMKVVLECGSSDYDTYGKFNSKPTTSDSEWKGYTAGGEDNTIDTPAEGRHYILVNRYSGEGSYTLTATITYESGGDTEAPTAPTNLTSSNITQTSVNLTWDASTDNEAVTAYDVLQGGSLVKSVTGTSTTVSNLTASTAYTFTVKAKDAAANVSSASNAVDITTQGGGNDDGGALTDGVAANGNINASDVSDMWYIEVGANATSMKVVLECGSNDFDTYGKFNTEPTTSDSEWKGYTAGGEDNTIDTPAEGRHYILVNRYSGEGSYTLTATITYESGGDTEAPTVPTNLASSNITQTSVDLTWDASTDNTAVTAYEVIEGGTVVKTVSGTSASITGLTASTAYTFTVKAKDAAANVSLASNSVTITTESDENNPTYCEAKSTNTGYESISKVQFGSIDQASGSNGYEDFTAVSTNLTAGNATTLSITTVGNYSSDELVVYIDYNRDGDFEDAGEEVYYNDDAGTAKTYTASITAPSSATSGSLRMRIIIFDTSYNPKNSCGDFNYGEVEDYTVNILPETQGGIASITELQKLNMTIYPIPSTDFINIILNGIEGETVLVTINSIIGKTVVHKTVNSSETIRFNVSDLESGVYLVNIAAKNGNICKQIVIK